MEGGTSIWEGILAAAPGAELEPAVREGDTGPSFKHAGDRRWDAEGERVHRGGRRAVIEDGDLVVLRGADGPRLRRFQRIGPLVRLSTDRTPRPVPADEKPSPAPAASDSGDDDGEPTG